MPSVERVRHDPGFRLLRVKAAESLTAGLRRITLAGELSSFHSASADDHVKLFFPSDGSGQMPVPERRGPTGISWPEDQPRPAARDYTPRRFDPQAGELTVDFVLHGDGPAASWARAADTGATIGQGGPRGSFVVSDDFDWYLLAGDETAIPAIGRRLEELAAGTRAFVIVETDDEAGRVEFQTQADLTLRWLERAGAQPGTTTLLQDAIAALELPDGDGFAWVAAEADSVRPIRQALRDGRAAPREWTRVTGYWKRGAADYHDPPDADPAAPSA